MPPSISFQAHSALEIHLGSRLILRYTRLALRNDTDTLQSGENWESEACALVGVVDTINDTENFELIAPLNIAEPPLLSVAGTIKEAWREKFVQQVGFYVKGFRASFGFGGRPRAALLHADTASLFSPYTLSEGSTFKLTYPLTLVNRRPAP